MQKLFSPLVSLGQTSILFRRVLATHILLKGFLMIQKIIDFFLLVLSEWWFDWFYFTTSWFSQNFGFYTYFTTGLYLAMMCEHELRETKIIIHIFMLQMEAYFLTSRYMVYPLKTIRYMLLTNAWHAYWCLKVFRILLYQQVSTVNLSYQPCTDSILKYNNKCSHPWLPNNSSLLGFVWINLSRNTCNEIK